MDRAGQNEGCMNPTTTTMTRDEMLAELARLQAQNEALKAGKVARVTLKVSEKGGVSVYGLGRFPVTLYPETWEKLLSMDATIRKFIAANKSVLDARGAASKAAKAAGSAAGATVTK
jgi:hypothetical protein